MSLWEQTRRNNQALDITPRLVIQNGQNRRTRNMNIAGLPNVRAYIVRTGAGTHAVTVRLRGRFGAQDTDQSNVLLSTTTAMAGATADLLVVFPGISAADVSLELESTDAPGGTSTFEIWLMAAAT